MNHRAVPMERRSSVHLRIAWTMACLMVLILSSTAGLAQDPNGVKNPSGAYNIRATHVLGLEGISNNANGSLSIQDNTLQFQKDEGRPIRVSLDSIQGAFVGEADKQVGGVPMTVGKVAAPYGGGRLIGLFAHKKYDTLTLEYLDANGGFHGAIFQLTKDQGQVLTNELVARGVNITRAEDQPSKQSTSEVKK